MDVIKNETLQTWLLNNNVNIELSKVSKNDTLSIIYNQHLHSITSELRDYTEIYTDGSKTENGIGAAVVLQDYVPMLKLPNVCSIFSAETVAISYHPRPH